MLNFILEFDFSSQNPDLLLIYIFYTLVLHKQMSNQYYPSNLDNYIYKSVFQSHSNN